VIWDWSLNIAILIGSCFALWKGSEWLVDSAARIGRRFRMSDTTIGLTIVAFGTSAPEFAVTVSAALRGQSNISVGNVVGSNIFNLGFILGGCVLFRELTTNRRLVYRDGFLLIAVTLLLVFFMWDNHLARWEGMVLFSGLIAYVALLLFKRESVDDEEIPEGEASWKDLLFLLLGIAGVVGGGHFLVHSASQHRPPHVGERVGHRGDRRGRRDVGPGVRHLADGRPQGPGGHLAGQPDRLGPLQPDGRAGSGRHPAAMAVDEASRSSVLMLVGMCVLVVILMRTAGASDAGGDPADLLGLFRWILDFAQH
jgi:cation:H+ antiporter